MRQIFLFTQAIKQMRKSAVDRLPHSSYRFGGWGKQLLAAVLITVVIGCGQQTAETSPVEPIAQSQHTFTTNDIEVTLTQGTNLAVTVNPVDTGQRVVSLQGTLFLLNENSPAQALTNAYFDAREPQFSPDGKTVVFHGYRNGNWDLWQVNLNGGEPQSLTQDAYDDREPQYSPDGHSVVFSSDRGGSYDIWQLDLASAEVVQLTQTQGNSYSPSLSSQGLAYTQRGKTGSQVTVQGSEKDRVVVEEAGLISGVQWSADASRISYQVLQGDQAAMKVVDATTGITAVVSQPGDDVFPFRAAWLGTDQLAYAVNGLVLKGTIGAEFSDWPFSATVTITRHDYQRRQRDYDAATKRPARGLTSPTISNDGEQIYFTALGDLWQWQPSQNQLHNLTDDPAADHSPTLSPDGYQLAFVSDRSGQVGLHVLHLDGEEESAKIVQLPVVANQISYPSFSADGGQIAFFVDVPGNPLGGQLTVLDIESGLSTKVLAPMPAQIISWSSDGQKLAVTQLNPYSSRYREGMYELVVADINGQATHKIAPEPHKSIVSAVLTPDGAMSYVQGARLHRLELDENYQPVESAGQMTQELTDMPSWSANGNFLVYASGDKLKRMDLSAGGVQDVTPQLHYQLEPADDSYVIRAGRVFVGDKNNVYVLDQDIWINGNRIEKIVPRQADLAGVEIVDASDKTVVAGLFEMHAHMGETSEVQGRVWLSYGITTVRDPGSNPYVAKERQEAWDSGRRVGPRTHVTGYLTDGNRVYYSMAEGITSGQHLQDALLRTQMLGLDFIKTYVRLPDHWQAEVVNFAHDIGIPVSSHELYPAVGAWHGSC